LTACIAAAGFFVSGLAAADFSNYHNHAEMTRILKDLARANPQTATLHSLGKSSAGREIWLMEIAEKGDRKTLERPGVFIGASFEGDHLIGGELALYTIEYLLKHHTDVPEVKKQLAEHVFYILPRLNPDGCEEMFTAVKTGRRTNDSPRDADNDGRIDEDGPEDLNGDGFIGLMRVKKPGADYMLDPADSRLMKKADPKKGEAGGYQVLWEGIDNDGDGFFNEDPRGGVDLNRNFMHDYPYFQPDAGIHMASEPEARALLEFFIAHRNIAAILTYGESDNMVTPPNAQGRLGTPKEIDLFRFADAANEGAAKVGIMETSPFGSGRRGRMMGMGEMIFTPDMVRQFTGQPPASTPQASGDRMRMPSRQAPATVNLDDLEVFKTVGGKYSEMTGIKQTLTVRPPRGAFFQYGYFQFGAPSFCTPGWGLTTAEPAGPFRPGTMTGMPVQTGSMASRAQRTGGSGIDEATAPVPGVDTQVLKWMDKDKIDGFLPWTVFRHPELGEVEIGGFKPYALANPPAQQIAALGEPHAKFALYLATLLPRVAIDKAEVTNLGGGLFQVKADIVNSGYLPTALTHAVTAEAVRPTLVQIEIAPDDILAGNPKNNFIPTLAGSGGRQSFSWIVRGKTGERITIRVTSQMGGNDAQALTLN